MWLSGMTKLAEVVICSEVLLGRRVRLGPWGWRNPCMEAKLKTDRREKRKPHGLMGPACNGDRWWVTLEEKRGPPTWKGCHIIV